MAKDILAIEIADIEMQLGKQRYYTTLKELSHFCRSWRAKFFEALISSHSIYNSTPL